MRVTILCGGKSATLIFALTASAQVWANSTPAGADTGAPINDQAESAAVQVEFGAGAADKLATIKLNITRLANEAAGGGGATTDSQTQVTATISTPWDGKSDAILANLDGLASGTKFKLGVTHYMTGTENQPTARSLEIEAQARDACKAKALLDKDSAMLANSDPQYVALRTLENEAAVKVCESARALIVIRAHMPTLERAYATSFFTKPLRAISFQSSVGYGKFGFVNPLTLVPGSQEKVGWSVGASFTQYSRASPTAFTIGFDYERAYKAQDKRILCPVPSGTAPVTCVQDHIGPPTLDESGLIRINLRHRFVDAKGKGILAISPSVTYDAFDNEWGFELPVYLVPGGDGNLTGGFKLGYTTEKDDFTFGIFVGAAFGQF